MGAFNFFISTILPWSPVFIEIEKLSEISGEKHHLFFWYKKTRSDVSQPRHKKIVATNKMKRYLGMIETSRPEPAIKEEILKIFICKIAIWDYFNISEATYKVYLVDEVSRLLTQYYSELFEKYYGSGEFFFVLFFDQTIETTLVGTKFENGNKKNATNIWSEHGYFKQQTCDFGLDKENFPESSLIYLNKGYLTIKDNRTVFYADHYLIGQTNECANLSENIVSSFVQKVR